MAATSTRYAIITGCSPCSIGFHAAKVLATEPYNFNVILACRNEQKGQEAQQTILAEHPMSNARFIKLDLASFDSIRTFVSNIHELDNGAIAKQYGLSLLINNAGIAWGPSSSSSNSYAETKDGLEEIVGVNHFGHFLLTNLLLNDLKRAQDGSRVVVVTSSLHDPNKKKSKDKQEQQQQEETNVTADSNDDDNNDNETSDNTSTDSKPIELLPSFPDGILLKNDENYDSQLAYKISKLCNLWFAYELQRRLSSSSDENNNNNVIVNSICPGFIPQTGLIRKYGTLASLATQFLIYPLHDYLGLFSFIRTSKEGGMAIVQASTLDDDIAKTGGQCFELSKETNNNNNNNVDYILKPKQTSMESMDIDKAKKLWEISCKICGIEK